MTIYNQENYDEQQQLQKQQRKNFKKKYFQFKTLMKILSAQTTQNAEFNQSPKESKQQNLKISQNSSKIGKKQLKKDKKILKSRKKHQISKQPTKEQIKDQISCTSSINNQKISQKKENFIEQSQSFTSINQVSNLPSLYEKVSELLFQDNQVSQQKNINKPKSVKKLKEKTQEVPKLNVFDHYLAKIKEQFSIKVLDLLQNSEKVLFKCSDPSDIQKFQNEAERFLSTVRFYKNKQSLNCGEQKLQQDVIIILRQLFQSKSTMILVQNNPKQCLAELKNILGRLNFCQQEYIKELQNFQPIWQKQISHKINQSQDLKQIAKILIVLLKCYKVNNLTIKKKFEQIFRQQKVMPSCKDISLQNEILLTTNMKNEQFYIKCLIKKCLIKTFSERQTLFKSKSQLWNFFKLNGHIEHSIANEGLYDAESYLQLNTQQQYREYIKRITNRRILFKPALQTSCKACFSNHVQKYNPIIKCPDCKYRIHKSCGRMQDRCDRCFYKKLSISLKQNTKKCFICENETNSLMILKMKSNRFAHNFCLMVHNLWGVQSNRLAFDSEKYSSMINKTQGKQENQKKKLFQRMVDEKEQKKLKNQRNEQKVTSIEMLCKFCARSSQNQQEFLRKCSNCNQVCHILCAYLHGCKIQIQQWKENFEIELNLSCCPEQQTSTVQFEQHRKKLEMCRKYKLNYQNYAINYEAQKENQGQNFTENIQVYDRKLTTSNVETQINNYLSLDSFQEQKMQEVPGMSQ